MDGQTNTVAQATALQITTAVPFTTARTTPSWTERVSFDEGSKSQDCFTAADCDVWQYGYSAVVASRSMRGNTIHCCVWHVTVHMTE